VSELREQSLAISTRTVIRKASNIDLAFKEKSNMAKVSVVKRLVKKLGLLQRVSAHITQKT
jgi:hypothetical protein